MSDITVRVCEQDYERYEMNHTNMIIIPSMAMCWHCGQKLIAVNKEDGEEARMSSAMYFPYLCDFYHESDGTPICEVEDE